MSDPMPAMVSSPSSQRPVDHLAHASARCHRGLMQTIPATSGCCGAVQQVSVPPIDSPTTTTLSQPAPPAAGTPPRPRPTSRPSGRRACPPSPCHGPGSSGQLDRPAGGGERLGHAPHRVAVAGEAVQHERAVRAASAVKGSAPGMIGAVKVSLLCSGLGGLPVGVVGGGLVPPVLRGGRPVAVVVDAVDGARVEALAAARAQLRDDDRRRSRG